MSTKIAILAAKNVKKHFQQGKITLQVLQGVDITFKQNRAYAITGASGSGKSTLMHILAGLDTPDEGSILFNDHDINTFSAKEKEHFLNKELGLVFQLPYLIKELTVLENVMIKGLIAKGSTKEHTQRALTLLERVGLHDKAYVNPATLSGGQQQRVALVRALFNKPSFLLADEPTGNLDVPTGKALVDLLLDCQKEWSMGLIISSHDEYVTHMLPTQLHLENGKLILKKGTNE